MSLYDEAVNNFFYYGKQMVKQINHAKGASDDLEELQILIFAGMLAYYGMEHFDDIYLAFLKCNFVTVDCPIEKVMRDKYKLSDSAISMLVEHCPGTFYDVEGMEFVNKKTRRRSFKFNKTIYVQNDGSIDKSVLIKSIAHQVNHVVNSTHNPVISIRGKLAARMGVSLDLFVSRTTEGFAVEEAYNELQTDEIIDEILGFSFFEVSDLHLKELLGSIFESHTKGNEKVETDDFLEIVRPLYSNERFNSVLVDRRISGRLNGIANEFDSKTSPGSYANFMMACNFASCFGTGQVDMTENKEKAKHLVKQYVANCED